MATALEAQLAQFAATTTNPLDLKAQRRAHAESLVYEPAVASGQDFDTIYDACFQGFTDLCAIDRGFEPFGRTLFAHQSKEQDRTQLTAAQNKELDSVLESFLSLVGSRLRLRPAILAIEWLVRRFKIHRYNTEVTLFTFLPYHNDTSFSVVFERLFSILPSKLPDSFRFIKQNRDALKSKNNQTERSSVPLASSDQIILAATDNLPFFASFNDYTLTCCRRGHEYDTLTSFWGRTIAQALAGQLDVPETRKEARQQKEEDVVRRILSTMNDGFGIRNTRDLRVACYTILAVLVSKVQLSDRTVDLLMNAVAKSSKPVEESDLMCLAVLSQARSNTDLPKQTCEVLLRNPTLTEHLISLGRKYDAGALLQGILVYACSTLHITRAKLDIVLQVVQSGILENNVLLSVLSVLCSALGTSEELEPALTQTLQTISNIEDLSEPAREVLSKAGFGNTPTSAALLEDGDEASEASEMDVDEDSRFDNALSQAAKQTVDSNPTTFLTGQASATYELLSRTALLAGKSQNSWTRLAELKCFQVRSKETLYVSFLLRFGSSTFAPSTRAMAFVQLAGFIRQHAGQDFQLLLPYVLVNLSDISPLVRKAAGVCLVALQHSTNQPASSHPVFALDSLHGHSAQSLLPTKLVGPVVGIFTDGLEELRLDAAQASKSLEQVLVDSKKLKATEREAVMSFIASFIESTPLIAVRVRLLHLLRDVSKIGSTTKTKALIQFIRKEIDQSTGYQATLLFDTTPEKTYWAELLGAISAASGDGLKLIKEVISDAKISDALRETAIERATRLWPSIKPEKQTHLAESLFDAVREVRDNSISAMGDTAADALRSLSLAPPALRAILDMLPELSETSTSKRRRTSGGHVKENTEDATSILQQWSFVLELVELSHNRDDLALLKQLNHRLTELHSIAAQLGSQAHYVEALLLDAYRGVVTDISQDANRINSSAVSVDVIIDIFKHSPSGQVQRSALLLVSTLARVFPDVIMHHIMPVFTKMGQSILRHSDDFSVHVADSAVNSIIPPLLDSFRKQKSGLQQGMVRVLLEFVVAYEHIPLERRMPLFSSLVKQLGDEDSLHLLVLLFVDKHGHSKAVGDFIVELLAKYNPNTQLQALKKSLDTIADACTEQPKPLTSQIIPSKDRKARLSTALDFLSLAGRVSKQPELHRNVALVMSQNDKLSTSLQSIYTSMTEHTLRLGNMVQSQRKLSQASQQLMDALLNLMPVHETISGMGPLLRGDDIAVQSQVLGSIEERVSKIRVRDDAAQKACIELLPQLEALLRNGKNLDLAKTIISCTDSIIERFGKKDSKQAISILNVIGSTNYLSSEEHSVQVIALFCLATAFQTFGEELVPILPRVLKLVYAASDASIGSKPNAAVFNATMAMFSAVLDNLSPFITKADVERLLRLCFKASVNDKTAEETFQSRDSTVEILAKRREESQSRDCISALSTTWTDAADSGVDAMLQHLRGLKMVVATISKKSTVKLSEALLAMFLQVLDTGSQYADTSSPRYMVRDLQAVEELVSQIIVDMVYKLNDSTFRPLFIRLMDWSAESEKPTTLVSHHASLYSFLHLFFDTLKSIVTGYASMILDDAATMLQAQPTDSQYDGALWTRIVRTLRAAFENDQDEYFQAPTRFNTICDPLVAQLGRAAELGEDALEELLPCIVAFAEAADSTENQKAINGAVLAHLRSEDPRIRLAAVQCQQQLTERLSDEWLAHLPEMLPFIGEVLEDDDEDVQNETRSWVSKVEGIIGESLSPMLH